MEAVAEQFAFNSCGRENLPAANQSRLSETEVNHSQEGTRGLGHFLKQRGKPTKHELHREVPFPDQYGCGNLNRTDPFSKVLSYHGGRLGTGANPLQCRPLKDE